LTSDGKTVIVADTRGGLHVLDASGNLRHQFRAHPQSILSVTAHPDGRRVATCDADGTIAVWELASGQKLAERRLGGANAIAFSDDGDSMFAIEHVPISRGKPSGWLLSADLSRVHQLDHEAALRNAMFAPGGAQLASLSDDGAVHIWNRDGSLITTL